MSHLESLNEPQKRAVLKKDGPILILAGAGAGKTKTITTRILHLIKEGVDPANILAITFTNKASKEMRDRVGKAISEDKEINRPISRNDRPFVSTFHSLGVHIIKEQSKLLGLPRHFSIFDKNDGKRAVREAIESVGLDSKQFEPGKIQNAISRKKGDFVTAEEYAQEAGNQYFPRLVSEIWMRYEKLLAKEKALDFDDLLLTTARLLQKNKEVLAYYQNIWRYIHVDEYQDTNRVQYKIVKLLAEKYRNICVVGDADQTIYSWRGADIKNILDFEKDYPEAELIKLEENYRSTKNILSVANAIIVKNKMRKDKNLFTRSSAGEKVGVYGAYDEADEATFVASRAKALIEEGASAREIAVLFRANFQSRILEEAFLNEGIAYQLLGVKFFERKEVKDILSFLRASLNPDSLSDIKRIINIPPRGIGKVTLLKMFSDAETGLSPTVKKKIADFRELLLKIKNSAETEKPSEVIRFIVKETGMESMFKKGNPEDDERLENIGELVSLSSKYDTLPQEEGLEKLLADASLASDQDDMIENQDAVKLMTVHASKGLEFDYVFISGLEENLFPHKRMNEKEVTDEQDEEERRLFYVALTRARKKIFLSYASIRTLFGSRQINVPSEFFSDIDVTLTEAEMNPKQKGKIIYFD